MKKLMLMALLGLVFSGCKEIAIKDGIVPAKYRAVTAEYLGVYQGIFEGAHGEIELSLDPNGKALLQYRTYPRTGSGAPVAGTILPPSCGEKIGNLVSVNVSKHGSGYDLNSATFKFNTGICKGFYKGNTLVLEFAQKAGHSRVNMSFLASERVDRVCRIEGPTTPGTSPHTVCDDQIFSTYLKGRFAR